mmetsp:Transcript_5455/g.8675  ORF Transcript_5455/g.8675 Transcript_5455/m.8675 type:complete len:89 (+) Transcript_5455:200-466(+)
MMRSPLLQERWCSGCQLTPRLLQRTPSTPPRFCKTIRLRYQLSPDVDVLPKGPTLYTAEADQSSCCFVVSRMQTEPARDAFGGLRFNS